MVISPRFQGETQFLVAWVLGWRLERSEIHKEVKCNSKLKEWNEVPFGNLKEKRIFFDIVIIDINEQKGNLTSEFSTMRALRVTGGVTCKERGSLE